MKLLFSLTWSWKFDPPAHPICRGIDPCIRVRGQPYLKKNSKFLRTTGKNWNQHVCILHLSLSKCFLKRWIEDYWSCKIILMGWGSGIRMLQRIAENCYKRNFHLGLAVASYRCWSLNAIAERKRLISLSDPIFHHPQWMKVGKTALARKKVGKTALAMIYFKD